MITWKYFSVIRKIKLKAWLSNRKIDSYEKLTKVLHALGVAPPAKSETVDWFTKKAAVVVAKVSKKAVDVKQTTSVKKAAEELAEAVSALVVDEKPVESVVTKKTRKKKTHKVLQTKEE